MAIRIVVIFADGREETIRDYDEFSEAVHDALKLADDHGNDNGDGSGPPERIQVRRGDNIGLSIAVIRGGLVGDENLNVKAH